jgi:ketosteroid isomerase-like protein
MTSDDVLIAGRFRAALEEAVRTGDHETALGLLDSDVEWITPQRTLRGAEAVRRWRVWGSSGESFDFEFAEGEWVDHGDGRIACDVHQVYRVKESGAFAYERQRRVQLTIRDGLISRYELRSVG